MITWKSVTGFVPVDQICWVSVWQSLVGDCMQMWAASWRVVSGRPVHNNHHGCGDGPLQWDPWHKGAGLLVLIGDLGLSQGESVGIYTDFRCAFIPMGSMPIEYGREEGLLALGSMGVECAKEILGLLGAVNLPNWIAMVRLPVHWRSSSHDG